MGPLFVAVGVGVVVNRADYRTLADQFLRRHPLIYLSGLLTMTAGLAIVITHGVWAADWRVAITILGWLATIGGAVRIICPQLTERIGRRVLRQRGALPAAGLIWLALGACFLFFGYFH
jgi:hypothetical protein